MSLPDFMLKRILDVAGDEVEQERLAREWVRVTRETREAAERIRAQMAAAPCSCASLGELAADGRCSRCWGTPSHREDKP